MSFTVLSVTQIHLYRNIQQTTFSCQKERWMAT